MSRTRILKFPAYVIPVRLAALVIGLMAVFPIDTVQAYEVRLPSGGRSIQLDGDRLEADWQRSSITEKRVLAPYLVDFAAHEHPASQPKVLALLREESDAFLRDYTLVASVYFAKNDPAARSRDFGTLMNTHRRVNTRVDLLAYHRAVENIRAGGTPASQDLLRICRFPEQEISCRLARLWRQVDVVQSAAKITAADLQAIVLAARPLIQRDNGRPAFYPTIARDLPDRLHALGLPLEAAILTERITHDRTDTLSLHMRKRIPLYLASAGDFESAIRFSMKYGNDDPAMLNARLDWMILAGRYREALEYIEKIGAEKFASANTDDYWSGFPLNAESIKLRGAMLMYLAGDSRNAARALEHLKDMEGTSIGGASARYFARLRLAQILLEENPELAHKIAEDVTYVAQAEGWYVLEYYATIIDGWADYFQKEYYKALINFIKARGILQGDNRQYAVTYAHQLGLLAVRNKMSPRGNYDALIKVVSDELEQHPYNRAIFTLRDWAPVSAGPEFFLSESIQNLHARGRHWDALNLLLKHARRQEFYFEPGRNPGGVRGFVTAVQWGRELNSFAYVPALFGRYSMHTQSVTAARDALPAHSPLTPQVFPDTASYLFSFPMQGQRKLYLVYPGTSGGRRTNFMYTMSVTGEQLSGMERSCSYDNTRGCAPYQELFRDLQAKLGAPTQPLYIQYTPEFDIQYERLLFPSGTLRPVMYFYHPEMSANAGRVTRREVYLPQGCNIPATISAANRVGDFENTMLEGGSTAGGAWVWPTGVDARLSSNGQERPVYLRRFVCGASQLRLWDLDRFAARPGPEAVMYTNRINESNLDRAFARHFADTGTTLIELHGTTGAQFADNLLTALRGDGRGHVRIQDAFVTIHKNAGGASGLRLILPAIPAQ